MMQINVRIMCVTQACQQTIGYADAEGRAEQ